MRLLRLIEFLRNRLKAVVRLCLAFLGCLILLDALLVDKEGAHTWMEHLPGFWALFGLGGCILLIVLSKWYGHLGIMKREEYYDE